MFLKSFDWNVNIPAKSLTDGVKCNIIDLLLKKFCEGKMPRFFLDASRFDSDSVIIDGENARHISKALRMRVADVVTLCDGENNEYLCELVSFTENDVVARVIEKKPCTAEPPYRVTLLQCLPKSDKLELVIQKSVELGVHRIIPVESSRCIVKLDDKNAAKKVERWQKIANEAAGQCGRGILPKICMPMDLKSALMLPKEGDLCLFCYEDERIKNICEVVSDKQNKTKDIYVLIGSEGGFSKEEVALAKENGFEIVGLGPRILRTETAPLCVLSIISAFLEL